jgi:hypothetical protein
MNKIDVPINGWGSAAMVSHLLAMDTDKPVMSPYFT